MSPTATILDVGRPFDPGKEVEIEEAGNGDLLAIPVPGGAWQDVCLFSPAPEGSRAWMWVPGRGEVLVEVVGLGWQDQPTLVRFEGRGYRL